MTGYGVFAAGLWAGDAGDGVARFFMEGSSAYLLSQAARRKIEQRLKRNGFMEVPADSDAAARVRSPICL